MTDSKPARESLSKVPSWIMLGFVIGCIVALAVKDNIDDRKRVKAEAQAKAQAAQAAQIEAKKPEPKPETRRLTLDAMEALFLQWKERAIWRHDVTEVAFWNPENNQYSEFVEIFRNGEELYFRTIPRLTRPLLPVSDAEAGMPLRFTETEESRAERRSRLVFP